jgi:hypothetical protein
MTNIVKHRKCQECGSVLNVVVMMRYKNGSSMACLDEKKCQVKKLKKSVVKLNEFNI